MFLNEALYYVTILKKTIDSNLGNEKNADSFKWNDNLYKSLTKKMFNQVGKHNFFPIFLRVLQLNAKLLERMRHVNL